MDREDMNIYKARYRNALKKAAKVNRLMKKGYILVADGTPNHYGFELRDNGETKAIVLRHSENCTELYYEHTSEYDHGYYTTIKDWNILFNRGLEMYHPSSRVKF
jgi:hypothetical protein